MVNPYIVSYKEQMRKGSSHFRNTFIRFITPFLAFWAHCNTCCFGAAARLLSYAFAHVFWFGPSTFPPMPCRY